MFQLQLPESDESEDTARAPYARVFRWAVRISTYAAIWLVLNSISAHATSRPPVDEQTRYRLPKGTHAWCDHVTGRCGIHDSRHREVGIAVP